MAGGGSSRAIIAALLANLGIAAAKFVGFLLTRASSMLAESVHSLADSGNQALLLLGGRQAKRGPTPTHPFGYGRERYFWSFVVAVVLFALGSLFALYEGFEKLREPHELESPLIAAAILVVGIVLETFSFRTAVAEARHTKGNESWWQFIRRSRNPELPVVLLEDLGALTGLVLALGAVGLAAVVGDPRFDAYGTLMIGVLLGIISIILAIEMKSLLVGEGASSSDLDVISTAITADERVLELLHLQTQHLGPDELLVAGKVALTPSLDFQQVVDAIDECERRVRQALPIARIIYLEPDRSDGGQRPSEGPGEERAVPQA